MSSISVSVIVPCYNVADRLHRCLDFLVNQTLSSLEIICVNDGSQDGTLSLLRQYEKTYSNIVVIDKEHEGASKAREIGINASAGAYCGFCDADDCVEPDTYQLMFQRAVSDGSDLVVCAYERIVDHRVVSTEMRFFADQCVEVSPDSGWFALVNTGLCNKLFKREILDRRFLLERPPRVMEDAMTLLSVLPSIKKISFIERPLYHYFTSKGSAMSYLDKEDLPDLIDSWKQVKRYVLSFDPDYEGVVDLMAFIHLGISAPLLMLGMEKPSMESCFEMTSRSLLEDFPLHERSPFLCKAYIDQYQGMKKVALAHRLYEARMIFPALRIYRFVTNVFRFDVKW